MNKQFTSNTKPNDCIRIYRPTFIFLLWIWILMATGWRRKMSVATFGDIMVMRWRWKSLVANVLDRMATGWRRKKPVVNFGDGSLSSPSRSQAWRQNMSISFFFCSAINPDPTLEEYEIFYAMYFHWSILFFMQCIFIEAYFYNVITQIPALRILPLFFFLKKKIK